MAGLWGLPARRAVLGLGAGWPPVEAPGHPSNHTAIQLLITIAKYIT